ncbi:MAG: BFD-like [2Fe-2S] binding domain, partial [bacterium]
LSDLLRTGADVPEELLAPGGAPAAPIATDPAATICSCNEVTVGEVQAAIRRDGLTTVAQVGARTRATTGCGGCGADVQQLLAAASAGAS